MRTPDATNDENSVKMRTFHIRAWVNAFMYVLRSLMCGCHENCLTFCVVIEMEKWSWWLCYNHWLHFSWSLWPLYLQWVAIKWSHGYPSSFRIDLFVLSNVISVFWKRMTLKWKCHFNEIVIICCTVICPNENIWCCKWWKFCKNDGNSHVSAWVNVLCMCFVPWSADATETA